MSQQFLTEGDRIKRNLSRVVYSAYLVQSNALQTGQQLFRTLNMTPGDSVDTISFGPTAFTPAELNAAMIQNGVYIPQIQPPPVKPVVPATVPAKTIPTNVVVGNQSITITWLQPFDGNSPILYYTLTAMYDPPFFPGGPTLVTPNALSTTATITGLTNGVSYRYTITSTNAVGNSIPSPYTFPPSVPTGGPDPPTSVAGIPGTLAIQVTWTAPINNGGSEITNYTVTPSPSGAIVTTIDASTYAYILDLTTGTPYTFTVVANTAIGSSIPSAPSIAVAPNTNSPSVPRNVTAVAGNMLVNVSWTAPEITGRSSILYYTVTSKPDGIILDTVDGNTTGVGYTGLTIGTLYTFTVTATSGDGTSFPSYPSQPVTPSTVPGAPVITSATSGNASITLTWTAPINNGGMPITAYEVSSIPADYGEIVSGSTRTVTATGLQNGTGYIMSIAAYNTNGPSPYAVTTTLTPSTVPNPPTIGFSFAVDAAVLMNFISGSDGGSIITGFIATSTPGGIQGTSGPGSTQITVTGLTNGINYTFTIRATNANGSSSESSPTGVLTPSTTPSAPTDVTAFGASNPGTVLVSWTPGFNGGSALTEYLISDSTGAGQLQTDITLTSYMYIDLTPGDYTFTVTPSNANGVGQTSQPSNSVTIT